VGVLEVGVCRGGLWVVVLVCWCVRFVLLGCVGV